MYVEMLKGVKAELHGELPVLVFAGAPFTVASYCIGTGKDLEPHAEFAQRRAGGVAGLARSHRHGDRELSADT